MEAKPKSKSILKRAAYEVGQRTHYLSEGFSSAKSLENRMIRIRKRRIEYDGLTAKVVHTLADGRQVRHTIQVVKS